MGRQFRIDCYLRAVSLLLAAATTTTIPGLEMIKHALRTEAPTDLRFLFDHAWWAIPFVVLFIYIDARLSRPKRRRRQAARSRR